MNSDELREEELVALKKAMEEDVSAVAVPESLSPDAVKEMLDQKKKQGSRMPMRRFAEVAAACAALFLVVGVGSTYLVHREKPESQEPPVIGEPYQNTYTHAKQVGDMYILAENYEEVINHFSFSPTFEVKDNSVWNFFEEDTKSMNYGTFVVEDLAEQKEYATAAPKGDSAFSATNLQVAGVDESDIVKTDGKYLYIAADNVITIVDVQEKEMEIVAKITPDMRASDEVCELYIENQRLYAIAETLKTNLRKTDSADGFGDKTVTTVLFTYDIADITNPVLLGEVKVEGTFKESRKVGDDIYLFSIRNLWGVTEKEKGEVIPYLQDQPFPEDCIYIREEGQSELMMVSVNTGAPSEIVDQVMVLSNGASIYVGKENIYLYNTNYYGYSSGDEVTEIAKFSYQDGHINAVGANSVKGRVEDTFAVSEKDEYFRILTTSNLSGRENQLYIFDEGMKLVGQLNGIAPGESIYAARYVGENVYFITYRNMDPLFLVNLSDPRNPEIMGELEISGFSDYLQMYGENDLLGIGYETNTRSGRIGGKLVMFDVTDPYQPAIKATEVIEDVWDIPGTYFYKGILADPVKNLIGFVTTDTDGEHYRVYRYEEDQFQPLLDIEMTEEYHSENVRGMYVGDAYYIVGSGLIRAFDIENAFESIGEITY